METRGFKRCSIKGAWYGNNHYSHATTYTSVGHATLLSCAHPYKHGVVGNDWIDKETGKRHLFDRGRATQVHRRGYAAALGHVAVQHEGHRGR